MRKRKKEARQKERQAKGFFFFFFLSSKNDGDIELSGFFILIFLCGDGSQILKRPRGGGREVGVDGCHIDSGKKIFYDMRKRKEARKNTRKKKRNKQRQGFFLLFFSFFQKKL